MVQESKPQTENLRKRFDEGLGTVYERFRLNYIFRRLIEKYNIKSVLEYPLYGMTGVDGINSVYFAQNGIDVDLVDCDESRINEVKENWKILKLENNLNTHCLSKEKLPFFDLENRKFDFVWNFAALWFYPNANEIIQRMIKLSNDLVMISVNNPIQLGYPLRKYLLDKEFFTKNNIATQWTQIDRVKSLLRVNGLKIIECGVFDTPPWPDTCLPVAELKEKLGIKTEEKQDDDWVWSMMAFYAGEDPELEDKVKRYMFIEDSFLPAFIKQFWSHHRYVIAQK